jgi:hypothetical protein
LKEGSRRQMPKETIANEKNTQTRKQTLVGMISYVKWKIRHLRCASCVAAVA